jgi:hypothetical protein
MTLDEMARAAVADLRTATAQARFTVRGPTARRRRWILGLAAAAVIAILAPLVWLVGPGNRTLGGPPMVSPTTPEELVEAVYTALGAQDDAALAALATPNARHGSYLLESAVGETPVLTPGASYPYDRAGLATAGPILVETTGAPIVSGDAVAVPVRYLYPDRVLTGFDLYVLTEVPFGLRIKGGASFLGQFDLAPDSQASLSIAAYITAWNRGAPAEVMASLGVNAVIWDDVGTGDATAARRGDEVSDFIATSLWFDVEMTGSAVASGPFLAVPNRLLASTDTSEGITVLLIHDGLIYLHAFAQ